LAIKLNIKDISAGYGAVRALHGVSLDLEQGQTVALLGTNGNGKSTLMKCVMGMVKPDSGSITLEIDGHSHDLTALSTEEIVNLGVALVPEGRRLFPKLTVEENLLLGAFRQSARAEIERNMAFSFEAFPVLAERRRQLAGSMSGGQQQMLVIGRALMANPQLIAIDEPSLGLAPKVIDDVYAVLLKLRDTRGLTLLIVEQSSTRATMTGGRMILLRGGEIVLEGDARELTKGDALKAAYFGYGEHH